jgi:DNA-binding NarL/FixJ family response regulator
VKVLRILIVEDEALAALDLAAVIEQIVSAAIVSKPSVDSAIKTIREQPLDFAFLDVNVTDGETFEIAQILYRQHVPFAFVSGSNHDELPLDLQSVPFICKPAAAAQVKHVLQSIV